MQKEEFLKLYKNYTSMNYYYNESNETDISKSLWFKLITLNKKIKEVNKWQKVKEQYGG